MNPIHHNGFERFRKLQKLTNHWARPASPPTYYWYLTFQNAPELHSLARQCQEAISFPYYDHIPIGDLHLTLDRIAPKDRVTAAHLHAIKVAAARACEAMQPFEMTVDLLGGTSGAIGFNAFPSEPIQHLRDSLRQATLSVYPNATIKGSDFKPHVAIAYCNSDNVAAAPAIAAVENQQPLPEAKVNVEEAALVLLERHQNAYMWKVDCRIPLRSHNLSS